MVTALANRPQRIILVRHGESQGNIDDSIYETVPDHALHLTPLGREQACAAGALVRPLIAGGSTHVYASPYVRARETLAQMDLGVPLDDVRIEPRLREQDWANFQDREDVRRQKELRNEFGHFYYRFTHGESGSDVYDRVSTFLESLFRNVESPDAPQHVVIVTHGMTMRLFCMRWFHWSVDYFESLENPPNGGLVVLERQADFKYRMREPFTQWDPATVPSPRERASWL